jgi:FkbM family methyltransferase
LPGFLVSQNPVAVAIRAVVRPIKGVLRRFGLDIVAYRPLVHSDIRSTLLARTKADMLVDVGANAGQYGRMMRAMGWTGPILSVEPLSAPFARLTEARDGDAGWSAVQTALGEADGEAEINVAGNEAMSSSFLDMMDAHSDAAPDTAYVGKERVTIRRLDEVVREAAPQARRIYLKIDTQGFEDRVLAGATGILDRVVAMELEVSFTPLYAGQKLFSDIQALAESHGFDLAWIEPGFADETRMHLLQGDALFVKRGVL